MAILSYIAALLLVVPTAYLVAVCGYLALVTLGAWCFRKRCAPDAPPLRFAVLVPAHNEEHHLGDILAAAKTMDYPHDHFDLFVIADNCNDRTAAIAREGGATPWERFDPDHPGKGQALDWAIRSHHDVLEVYDAIALVDADMHIDPEFLRELSSSLSAPGVDVVQALNTVAKPEQTWRTGLGYLGFTVINHVRPAGRNWLGGTAELKGSGMAFRRELLLHYGWPAHSIAEDAEFGKQLFLDGVIVQYNPDAMVTSEIPVRPEQARIQQSRWEGGKIVLHRKYLPILTKRFLARPTLPNLDALLDLLVPPQSALVALLGLCWLLSLLAGPVWTAVLSLCGLGVVFCILSGLLLRRAPLIIWGYLLAVPLLLFWKLPLLARMLVHKGGRAWQRTPRDPELAAQSQEEGD